MSAKSNMGWLDGIGYLGGETCNRDGCSGIIANKGKDGGCSCHHNPPCSYCTTSDEFCPDCGWDGYEEQMAYESPINTIASDVLGQLGEHSERLRLQMSGALPITKFDYIAKTHTYSSMIKEGVYPAEMTKEDVLEKVRGTFGGRFEHFGNGKFKYIAYTD